MQAETNISATPAGQSKLPVLPIQFRGLLQVSSFPMLRCFETFLKHHDGVHESTPPGSPGTSCFLKDKPQQAVNNARCHAYHLDAASGRMSLVSQSLFYYAFLHYFSTD